MALPIARIGRGGLSLEALVRHRAAIDAFVTAHRLLARAGLCRALYRPRSPLSLPGATILTVTGGFLFGLVVGALGRGDRGHDRRDARLPDGPHRARRAAAAAGRPARRHSWREGFRDDAFSYLLFLRLVPAFPFFLVNLVPAFAGVRLGPFVAATALGVIPASFVYAFAGTGLDSVIVGAEERPIDDCLAAGRADCQPGLRRRGCPDAATARRAGRARPAGAGAGGGEATAGAAPRAAE